MSKINNSTALSQPSITSKARPSSKPIKTAPPSKDGARESSSQNSDSEQNKRYKALAGAIALLKGKNETSYVDESIIREILNDAEKINELKDLITKSD